VLYAQFTSGVNLVEVYATVTDRLGEPVAGLTAADFAVSEDGAPQAITAFAAGEFPLAVAIGLDRSFSMADASNRLGVAKSAARTFIGALRKTDHVMVIAIGGDNDVVAPLSTDHAAALAAIDRLDAWGTTPLYDAALSALDRIQSANGRRALVLLSDGTDRYSDTRAADLVDQARRRDVLIYPIALGAARPPVFAELATATGGRSFHAREPRDLLPTMAAIARELRFQYLLGYVPARASEPGWHAIDVNVNRAGLRVRARDGYFSR
jgi:Ca-activated chloride channel family protein